MILPRICKSEVVKVDERADTSRVDDGKPHAHGGIVEHAIVFLVAESTRVECGRNLNRVARLLHKNRLRFRSRRRNQRPKVGHVEKLTDRPGTPGVGRGIALDVDTHAVGIVRHELGDVVVGERSRGDDVHGVVGPVENTVDPILRPPGHKLLIPLRVDECQHQRLRIAIDRVPRRVTKSPRSREHGIAHEGRPARRDGRGDERPTRISRGCRDAADPRLAIDPVAPVVRRVEEGLGVDRR